MRTPASLPLRLRLALAFALSVAVVLAGLAVFLYARLGAELRRGVDLALRSRAGAITSAIAETRPVPINAGRSVIDPDEAFAQVLDRTGHIIDTSAAVRGAPMLPAVTLRGIDGPTFLTSRVSGIDDPSRLLAVPVRAGGRALVVVVGTNLGDENEAQHRLLLLLEFGIPAAILLASGTGWLVAGAGLRPVEQMRRDAAAAAVSESGAMIAVPGTRDELARLASTLNDLLTRQREALDAERRFLDEASHDLRTPLAVLKAELDLALLRPRSQAELEQTLRTAGRETDQLVRLAEDLLVLARTRRGPMPLRREPVRLDEFCADCAAPFQTAHNPVAVRAGEDVVDVDPVLLRQAVRNLLDNAFRHGSGAAVTLEAECTDHRVDVTVTDAGPGLPGQLRRRLSRSDTGADGLGLSIVAAVAQAHGGYAEASNAPSGGASVTIVLPTLRTHPLPDRLA
jgi:two-component system OmpR family sensor kinase